jgi:hypothetical protein
MWFGDQLQPPCCNSSKTQRWLFARETLALAMIADSIAAQGQQKMHCQNRWFSDLAYMDSKSPEMLLSGYRTKESLMQQYSHCKLMTTTIAEAMLDGYTIQTWEGAEPSSCIRLRGL